MDFIKRRLRLAQALLEEADRLPGPTGFDYESKDGHLSRFHPCHEREALVHYLLLTCLDKLGQSKNGHVLFVDWLKSKKPEARSHHDSCLRSLPEGTSSQDAASELYKVYERTYGVKNAFNAGIDALTRSGKSRLLSSVRIGKCPNYDPTGSSISGQVLLAENDPALEEKRRKWLYAKRNSFTHKLQQYDRNSTPRNLPGRYSLDDSIENASSYWVRISRSGEPFYLVRFSEVVFNGQEGVYYSYQIDDWPFVLFEVLWDAVGHEFDRTSIQIKITLELPVDWVSPTKFAYEHINLDHCQLKPLLADPGFQDKINSLRRNPDVPWA